jgi:hypothetical protein
MEKHYERSHVTAINSHNERSTEMTRRRTNCFIALVLCCLPALAGCVDQEKKKALADLQTTEAALASANRDLAAARAALDTTQKERIASKKAGPQGPE